jgi:hypothetical protein
MASWVALAVLYGLVFHALSRALVVVFGAVPVESPGVVPLRDLAYLFVSSASAAAVAAAAWVWRYRKFAAPDAWGVGCVSALLIASNLLAVRGPNGIVEFFAARPVHASASFVVALVAVPVLATIAGKLSKGRSADAA